MNTTAPAPAPRVAWLDLARGLSIALVVLYHAGYQTGGELIPEGSGAEHFWGTATWALVPLRMPLFFLVAGLLAAGAVHRPWRRVRRSRIADLLWPYVLWSLIFALTAWPRYAPEDPVGFLGEEVGGLLVVASPYWFLAALPVFFLLARAGRHHPRVLLALVVVAFIAAPVLRSVLRADPDLSADVAYGAYQLTDNALWFVLGVQQRERILAAGRVLRTRWGILALVLAALASTVWTIQSRSVPTHEDLQALMALRGIELLASVTGLGACVLLLPRLAHWHPLARLGSAVGSRTLAIYLVHPLVLNTVIIVLAATGGPPRGPGALGVLLVPALAVAALGAGILVDVCVRRWGPRWLLAAPGGGPRTRVTNGAGAARP